MVGLNGRFTWFELMTPDADGARAFYAAVMGWSTKDTASPGSRYTLFVSAGVVVAGLAGLAGLPAAARDATTRARWLGYVGVADVDATVGRIERLGGTVLLAPRDMGGISRFAVLADLQSAMLAILTWSNRERHETPDQSVADKSPPASRVEWHELLAVDWEKTWPFYSELFGWDKAETEIGPLGTYQHFAVDGQTIGGMLTKPASVPMPHWLHYFTVADIDGAARAVTTSGGEIIDGPTRLRDGRWIARCIDPQGAVFGVIGARNSTSEGKQRYPTIHVYKGDRRPSR